MEKATPDMGVTFGSLWGHGGHRGHFSVIGVTGVTEVRLGSWGHRGHLGVMEGHRGHRGSLGALWVTEGHFCVTGVKGVAFGQYQRQTHP